MDIQRTCTKLCQREQEPCCNLSCLATGTKKDEIEEEEVYSSVDSESDQVESEYQEDFEEDEEQLSATPVSKKSGVQTSSRPVARKV